jgi:transcriptional regulator GlxA family with amidase domain
MTIDRRTLIASTLMVGAAGCASAGARTVDAAPIEPIRMPEGGIVRAAFLMDEAATMIDFAGPWEAFQDAGPRDQGFENYTVAPSAAPIVVSGGMEIVPKYTLANAPQPSVVVIPAQRGGRIEAATTAAKVEWLRAVAPNADVVLSVCTGAFLLARTGLLDGLLSTTHFQFYDDFEAAYPRVTLLRGRRFVDNDKFVSSGALTSGVDAALHVVARYFGEADAVRVAAYMDHQSDGWRTGMRA